MNIIAFITRYKKQVILITASVGVMLLLFGLYILFFHTKDSGTLLEKTPEEIARMLREERASDIAMSDEERIRADPISYVESNLAYYYAIKKALGAGALIDAVTPAENLSIALDVWYAVVLSDNQREQIDVYRSAMADFKIALITNDQQSALSAFSGLRYLETMVLEARKDSL